MLAVSGFRSWQHYQQKVKLESSARQLLAFLTRLQIEASWYNQKISLWVKRDSVSWCIGHNGMVTGCKIPATGVFIPLYPDILLPVFNRITFHGLRGTATSDHLTLSNSAGSVRVVFTGYGRLRLCSENRQLMGIP